MIAVQKLLKKSAVNWFLLASFLLIWAIYFAVLGLLNYESLYGPMLPAIALQIAFIALTLIFAFALPAREFPPQSDIAGNDLKIIVFVGIGMSLIGIGCLFTDKMLLGINYMKDICSARYQMVDLAQGRTGVRSIYSFLGNLLSTSFFIPMVAVITQDVTRKLFYTTAIFSFSCLLTYSFLASSRTSIMLFGAFSLAAICIRLWSGRGLPKLKKKDLFFVATVICIAAIFVGQVFACRAHNSNLTATQYEESFANFLGAAEKNRNSRKFGQSEVRDEVRGIVGVTALYFVHSAYIFTGILYIDERPGHVLFVYAQSLLSKIGLVTNKDNEPNWYFAGKFPSLPGGLYYDYGMAGLISGASFLGLLAGFAGRLWRQFPKSVVLMGVATSLYVAMFLSPLLFAGDVMTFPFILFSFVITPILSRVISKLIAYH